MSTPPITAVREHALDLKLPAADPLALLLDRWQAACDGQDCPRGPAEAYVPHDIRGLSGKVNIIDVDTGMEDFRFRLLGKRNHRMLHEMIPGSAISTISVPAYRDLLLRHYGEAARTRRPTLHRVEIDGETRHSSYKRLLLPLSSDGGSNVTALISATLCEVTQRRTDTQARTLLNERAAQIPAEMPRLRRYALRLTRNSSNADDLVQDSVERALSQLHMLVPGYPLRPWLFAIMHNTHATHSKRSRRQPFVDAPNLPETFSYTDPVFESQGVRADIDRSLQALPPQQKQVVELVLIHGMSYQRAADRLSIPIGTVMSRRARGRDKLRELLAA